MQADIVLFDDFETLDVFGPAEIFGRSPHYTLNYCSLSGGVITSSQGAQIITTVFEPEKTALMLVPEVRAHGGWSVMRACSRRCVPRHSMHNGAFLSVPVRPFWRRPVCLTADRRHPINVPAVGDLSVRTGKLGEKSTLVCGRPFLYLFRCIGGHGYGAGIYC